MKTNVYVRMEETMAHTLVPSDRVEGAPVYGRDGRKLGTIERLMLEKATGTVAYAVVRHSGFLGSETHHYPVLWNALKFNPERRVYEADLTLDELRSGVCELDGEAFDWGDRSKPYSHPLYWGV
jgi:sporulation protein YlmC with PRC-barrel domain